MLGRARVTPHPNKSKAVSPEKNRKFVKLLTIRNFASRVAVGGRTGCVSGPQRKSHESPARRPTSRTNARRTKGFGRFSTQLPNTTWTQPTLAKMLSRRKVYHVGFVLYNLIHLLIEYIFNHFDSRAFGAFASVLLDQGFRGIFASPPHPPYSHGPV